VDNASGIRQIDYTIYDATLKQSIRQGSQNGTTRDAPQDQTRRKRVNIWDNDEAEWLIIG